MADDSKIEMVADVAAAYFSANQTPIADIGKVFEAIHSSLQSLGAPVQPEAVVEPTKPSSAQIRKSIQPDHLVSFIDGKPYKTLKRHLSTHGLTIDDYKTKFGLGRDYPTVSPNYSAQRSAMAKSLGLGRKAAEPVAKPVRAPRKAKPAAE